MKDEERVERVEFRWDALSLGSLVGIACAIYLVYRLREVLLVLVASVFLAYVLEPLVLPFSRLPLGGGRVVGRKPAAGIVVLGSTALIGLGLYWLVPTLWSELQRLGSDIPRYVQIVEEWLRTMADRRGMGLPPEVWTSIQNELHNTVSRAAGGASRWVLQLVSSIGSLLGVLVVPIGAFYILADGGTLTGSFVDGLPVTWRPMARTLMVEADRALETYVRGQALVVLVCGALATVLFTLLGVHYSLALGVIAGLAEAVPFIGSIAIIGSLALVCYADGPGFLLTVLAAYVALNQFNNYVITPRLMGRRLDLHPFVVILAVLAGSSLGGFLGAVLALPATALLFALAGTLWGAGRPAPESK